MIGKILKFIIKLSFTLLSLEMALIVIPFTYIVCMVWSIYLMIATKQNFAEQIKDTNEMIMDNLLKPYMNALTDFWEA